MRVGARPDPNGLVTLHWLKT